MILMGTADADVNTSNWHLHEGTGVRNFPLQVPFKSGGADIEFPQKPGVLVSLTHIDADRNANVRVVVSVSKANVTKVGFTANFRTWSDSKIYGLGVSWIAIG